MESEGVVQSDRSAVFVTQKWKVTSNLPAAAGLQGKWSLGTSRFTDPIPPLCSSLLVLAPLVEDLPSSSAKSVNMWLTKQEILWICQAPEIGLHRHCWKMMSSRVTRALSTWTWYRCDCSSLLLHLSSRVTRAPLYMDWYRCDCSSLLLHLSSRVTRAPLYMDWYRCDCSSLLLHLSSRVTRAPLYMDWYRCDCSSLLLHLSSRVTRAPLYMDWYRCVTAQASFSTCLHVWRVLLSTWTDTGVWLLKPPSPPVFTCDARSSLHGLIQVWLLKTAERWCLHVWRALSLHGHDTGVTAQASFSTCLHVWRALLSTWTDTGVTAQASFSTCLHVWRALLSTWTDTGVTAQASFSTCLHVWRALLSTWTDTGVTAQASFSTCLHVWRALLSTCNETSVLPSPIGVIKTCLSLFRMKLFPFGMEKCGPPASEQVCYQPRPMVLFNDQDCGPRSVIRVTSCKHEVVSIWYRNLPMSTSNGQKTKVRPKKH